MRVFIAGERVGFHGDAISWRGWRQIPATINHRRIQEMLVEVIGVFQRAMLKRGADTDVIKNRKMLDILAQAQAARVWADGHAEFGGEQQHRQHFIDAAESAAIKLAEVHGFGLQELLEHDAIVAMLAGLRRR